MKKKQVKVEKRKGSLCTSKKKMPKERRKSDAGKEANMQKDKLRNADLKK